jgi:hypothetical protein
MENRKISLRFLKNILDHEERDLAQIYCHFVGVTKRDEKRNFEPFFRGFKNFSHTDSHTKLKRN